MTAPDPRLGEIEARDRVAEFARQWRMNPNIDPSGTIYNVWFDVKAEDVELNLNDIETILAELRKRDEALARVEALADEWESQAGPGTRAEEVFGLQKVSVGFAVKSIRTAVTAAKGDGE